MASSQDQPDDKVVLIADGLELLRAFRRIDSAELRRKVINLTVALTRKKRNRTIIVAARREKSVRACASCRSRCRAVGWVEPFAKPTV
jgi:hypothetical protein